MARAYLSHFGIFVRDIDLIERFYTDVFGLFATDRGVGKTFRNQLVFLTGDPRQHHQLVLSAGRAPDSASTVMQLSFTVDSLDELRATRDKALAAGATGLIGLNHGNAWSIYFDDPEGNKVEVYLDTPFHVPQPCGEPLNLEQADDALLAETRALAEALPGFMPRAQYVEELARTLGR
jgi:catechol 2,3-dioxygenase